MTPDKLSPRSKGQRSRSAKTISFWRFLTTSKLPDFTIFAQNACHEQV